jgi:hypothetical protein
VVEASAAREAVFASNKFPYRICVPPQTWHETPEVDTGSRFADLKLTDKSRNAQVVISPRETTDIDAAYSAYLSRQKKVYANVAVRSGDESLTVRGRPAKRVRMFAEFEADKFFFAATFIRAGKYVYQIECRAAADKFSDYEPIFARLVDGFEPIDEAQVESGAQALHTEKDSATKSASEKSRSAGPDRPLGVSEPSGGKQPPETSEPKGVNADAKAAGAKSPAAARKDVGKTHRDQPEKAGKSEKKPASDSKGKPPKSLDDLE